MITAVDTNVLVDIFTADRKHGPDSREAIRSSLGKGSLIASDVVWTEVATLFESERDKVLGAMDSLGVRFVPATRESALAAARFWRRYRSRGGQATRVAADFIVGAHALVHADRLLTRDRGFYRGYFEGLTVVAPSAVEDRSP